MNFFKKKITENYSILKRYEKSKSKFLEEKGDRIFLDEIEEANSQISNKILPCEEEREFNIFEENIYFGKKGKKINENFRLFISFNSSKGKINNDLIEKSILIVLPELDKNFNNGAQMLHGNFKNFGPKSKKILAYVLAKIHQIFKNESEKKIDFFSGKIPFNGRTLILAKFFENYDENNFEKYILKAIDSVYLNSINDENEKNIIKKQLISLFENISEKDKLSNLI